MKLIGSLFKLFVPILSAILGLVIANKYNFFATLPFVPKESVYDICITVYFAIASLIISELVESIKNTLGSIQSRVEVILCNPNAEADLNNCPTILFNREGIAEAQVNIHLKGKKKHYKNMKVVIYDTGFITLQPPLLTKGATIEDNGNYIIDLQEMTGNGTTIDVCHTFRIVMGKDIPDGSRTMVLKPDINKQTLWIKYNCNRAIIKAEGH